MALTLVLAAPTDAACRQALALGLDISGSVDTTEYRLQLDGLAAALQRPRVVAALLDDPETPVDLAIFEWSDPGQVRLTQRWASVVSRNVIDDIAARLRDATRPAFGPSTGLGAAMAFGAGLLAQRAGCWQRTLDISGDGPRNTGPRPRDVRAGGTLDGITVNALAIGADAPSSGDARQVEIAELSSYFRAEVIHGPDAFVETALGFDDYADAMERKLLRELRVVVLGAAQ
nr:DUF1194 domain-containing protein [Palleronia pontilimi]